MPWTVALVTDHRANALYGADTSGGQIAAGRLESGGDIQATTKIVDCRSLKSSPPNFQIAVIQCDEGRRLGGVVPCVPRGRHSEERGSLVKHDVDRRARRPGVAR